VLDQEGVDRGIGVEPPNGVQEGVLAVVGADPYVERGDADPLTRLVLLADVTGAGGVLAHQDRPQAGPDPLGAEALDPGGDVGQDSLGHGGTGEQLCGHRASCLSAGTGARR
jgi:hypothetical protein